jgi:hypothetical protein
MPSRRERKASTHHCERVIPSGFRTRSTTIHRRRDTSWIKKPNRKILSKSLSWLGITLTMEDFQAQGQPESTNNHAYLPSQHTPYLLLWEQAMVSSFTIHPRSSQGEPLGERPDLAPRFSLVTALVPCGCAVHRWFPALPQAGFAGFHPCKKPRRRHRPRRTWSGYRRAVPPGP